MIKKFISLLLVLSLIFSLSITAFAEGEELFGDDGSIVLEPIGEPIEPTESTEPTEPTEEPTESTEPIDEPIDEPTDEPTEPSEGSESTNQNITVDVSENSIQAIADAVMSVSDDGSTSITLNDGVVISIPEFMMEEWNNYTYHTIGRLNSYVGLSSKYYYVVFCNVLPYASGSDTLMFEDGIYINTLKVTSYTSNDSTFRFDSANYSNVKWCDYNLLDKDGNLLVESEVPIFHTISFDSGFEDLIFDSQLSNSLSLPVPSYEGYQFDGWYLDKEFLIPYTSDYIFVENTTLYAKWTPYVTISFVTNIEDYNLDGIKVLAGSSYTPSDFYYSGYTFYGVYTDEDFENQFVSGTSITENITLYLRFEPVVYDYGALMNNQVALMQEQLQRMEGMVYVQVATSVVLSALFVCFIFFRRKAGTGC